MRRTPVTILATMSLAAVTLATACSTKSSTSGSPGSSTAPKSGTPSPSRALGQGVTADAIKIGVTYPDLNAVKQFINITHGDYKAAYTAVINDINSSGGINGRKLVPVFAPVNPIGTAPADAACTKLTEDEKVFAVLGAASNPTCYITTHGVPLIGASVSPSQEQGAKAPWFWYNPTNAHAIVKVLDAVNKQGDLKGKKVAVVGLSEDQADMNNVALPELRKLGANVVQTAINSAPSNDVNAGYQQFQLIARKFQSAGVAVVVAVGNAGQAWPKALQVNRSTYLPRLVATYRNALAAYVADNSGNDPAVLKAAITGDGNPPANVAWNDPKLKSCIALIQKAEPSASINSPVGAGPKTPNTWVSPIAACQNLALFRDIVSAAGKTLNNDTFNTAGESLNNVELPGFPGTPLHYGPNSHDGDGPIYLSTYDETQKNLVVSATPFG